MQGEPMSSRDTFTQHLKTALAIGVPAALIAAYLYLRWSDDTPAGGAVS